MGWTTTSDYERHFKGLFTIKEYLDREMASDHPDYPRFEILDSSLHGKTEYYAAVRRTDRQTGQSVVFGMVVLVSYKPRDPDGHTLGWKEVTEEMGPYNRNCPERILAKLDPTDNENALEWRRLCRENRAKKRAASAVFQTGTVVRFKTPLHFPHGVERQTFAVEKQGRKLRFRAEDGVLCRIPKAQDMAFEVVSSAA